MPNKLRSSFNYSSMAYYHKTTPSGAARNEHDDYGRDQVHDPGYEPYPSHDRAPRYELAHDSRGGNSMQHSYRGAPGMRPRSRSRSPRAAVRGQRSTDPRGRSGGTGNYYDRDAPADRSRSRSPPLERFVSRDVMIEGFGTELQDDDVVTPTKPI